MTPTGGRPAAAPPPGRLFGAIGTPLTAAARARGFRQKSSTSAGLATRPTKAVPKRCTERDLYPECSTRTRICTRGAGRGVSSLGDDEGAVAVERRAHEREAHVGRRPVTLGQRSEVARGLLQQRLHLQRRQR